MYLLNSLVCLISRVLSRCWVYDVFHFVHFGCSFPALTSYFVWSKIYRSHYVFLKSGSLLLTALLVNLILLAASLSTLKVSLVNFLFSSFLLYFLSNKYTGCSSISLPNEIG